jgi:dynein heavy chain 1
MNPANPDFSNRTASSPALFNRCVVDWFGDWSDFGMEKVAESLIKDVEIPDESFINKCTGEDLKRAKLSETIVAMHGQV